MSSSDVIQRLQQDADGLDFASLRADAIARAQELAGNIWTDYNLHDPGVTILEQLCFGLTELAYQTRVPVADYLANERGLIDFNHYALYKPHDIFPTRPITAEDYCKRLLDDIPEIDALQVATLATGEGYQACLYNISIKLLEPLTGPAYSDEQKQQVVRRVRSVFVKHRNLGEDLATVSIEESKPCFLRGVIETNGKRNQADIYADVFFQVARKISSNIRIERYETMAQQMDLADIFSGPLTQHGYIYSEHLNAHKSTKALEELTGLVAAIDGVKKVYRLELVDELGKLLDTQTIDNQSFFLKFPAEAQQQEWLKIDFNPGKTTDPAGVVKTRGDNIERLMEETRRALQKLEFEYRAFRNNKTNSTHFYPLPQGRTRRNSAYYSIQHHFPSVYGINAAGVPNHETAARKKQAQQLKAYLYPFEQLMANMLAHIQNLQHLFSLGERPNHSYFAEFLDNQHIPDFALLYNNKRIGLSDIQDIQARHDPATDRKSRALDTLLAIYGEEFSQEALLHFNYYHEAQPDYWAIDNKIRYLQHLVETSSGRSAAFDTSEAHWQASNLSSLHKKINILLGIQQLDSLVPLSQCFDSNQIHLVDDQLLDQIPDPTDADALTTHADAQTVPALKAKQQEKLSQWSYTPNKSLTLCPAMIIEGTTIDAYRLQPVDPGEAVAVYFYSQRLNRRRELKKADDRAQAISYVHKFKKIITDINAGAEGFYLLEHILLRPRGQQVSANDGSFFDCQVSFIFPKWTARFANPAFRQFAEKTIANHMPAHLFPQIYWLDLPAMTDFDACYKPWLERLQQYEQQQLLQEHDNTEQLDRYAQQLRRCLEQYKPSAAYWI
ncbi:hypothetical protein [Cellvibrio sp.]